MTNDGVSEFDEIILKYPTYMHQLNIQLQVLRDVMEEINTEKNHLKLEESKGKFTDIQLSRICGRIDTLDKRYKALSNVSAKLTHGRHLELDK